MNTRIKTKSEIDAMREGGHMLASVLRFLRPKVTPGITTKDLADLAAKELQRLGGQPAFLGYQGFPDVLCVSVNDEVVHGVPSRQRIIKNGDIVSLDFGVRYQNMITDGAISVIAGKPIAQKDAQLLKITEKALHAGIGTLHNNVRVGDISSAIEKVLQQHKYGIVRDMVGHGVGHDLHEDPNIPNYGYPDTGPWLKTGMTVAIEPMATLGTEQVETRGGWPVFTKDGSRAAHFEHTVLITDDGYEILTQA